MSYERFHQNIAVRLRKVGSVKEKEKVPSNISEGKLSKLNISISLSEDFPSEFSQFIFVSILSQRMLTLNYDNNCIFFIKLLKTKNSLTHRII